MQSDGFDIGQLPDALDAGLIGLDRTERVAFWNAWASDASGIGAADALGKHLGEVFPSASLNRLNSAVRQALISGASSVLSHSLHPGMLPLRTRSGRPLIANLSVRPVGDGCIIQIMDVTLATERVLRARQNARYDAVVASAPDAILTIDARGTIQLANPATAREFGYNDSEFAGRTADFLFQDPAAWDRIWIPVRDGNRLPRAVEIVGRRKDGSPSYVEVSASRWESDSRIFVTTILRDVNERRAAEDSLRTLNQTLEMKVAERTADRDRMWRLSTDVMLVAKLDGTIQAVNPAWTQGLGWQEDEFVGKPLTQFVVSADRTSIEEALADLGASTAPQLFEVRMLRSDGGSSSVAWSAVAGDGVLQAVGRDVTNERAAAAALREAEDALRQSQKMEAIGQLTGGIAHDFNNLLTGIVGAMDVLKRRIAANRFDDVQRFMDAAVASSNRAAALTHRLLAFARRQPLAPKATDPNGLVRGMEDMLRRTLGEQVQLDVQLNPEQWFVFTDAHQLENAVLNLAINARDAMPAGGRLTIATRNVTAANMTSSLDGIEPGEYAVIAVRDTGTGIAPDVVGKVFEPFFTTKPIGQGTGLGLSMIYGFAKQSRGHVTIESEVDVGTEVALYLPRHVGTLPEEAQVRLPELARGAGETVLVVEDDSSVRLLIAEVLRELGYACIEVGDSNGAIPILKSNARLDLMITDVGLPGLNGRALAEIARGQRPDLKILFVTGYAEHATDSATFLEPGMTLVTKPFALDALALKIRELIVM